MGGGLNRLSFLLGTQKGKTLEAGTAILRHSDSREFLYVVGKRGGF